MGEQKWSKARQHMIIGQGYNAKCGKSATGILRNGDVELTLKRTLTLIVLTLN